MPSSVSFWTTHSGRSPLTGAKATVSAGSVRASSCTAPSPPTPAVVRRRLERCGATPDRARPMALPVGRNDLFTVAQTEHAAQMVDVLVREQRLAGIVHEDLGRPRPPARQRRRRVMPALAKGRAQAREHALAAARARSGDPLAACRSELAEQLVLLGCEVGRCRHQHVHVKVATSRDPADAARPNCGCVRCARAVCPVRSSGAGARPTCPRRSRCPVPPGRC